MTVKTFTKLTEVWVEPKEANIKFQLRTVVTLLLYTRLGLLKAHHMLSINEHQT